MKEKIIEFIIGLPSKYGWKFWAAIIFGVLFSISAFQEHGFGMGLLYFIPFFFVGIGAFIMLYWIYYAMFMFFAKTGKAVGKGAKAAGKGAVFVTAAGVAAGKGKSISSSIAEGGKAVNATKRLFGGNSEPANYEDFDEEDEPVREEKKESRQERKSTSNKRILKVWTCTYIGRCPGAPSFIHVPSTQQCGHPSGSEILEVLENMGYDHATAHAICNGGATSDWKFE